MALICGIDEAGRGPIIGPLVICGAVIDEKDGARLKSIGVKDSKLLTPKQREDLFDKVKSIVKSYKILIIEPDEIDDAVESDTLNLNWLEAIKSAEIMHELEKDVKFEKAILDCPSNNISAYKNYVKNEFKKLESKNKINTPDKSDKKHSVINIIAEHKADFNYPVVSAASILAKVTRDAEIHKIEQKVRKELGNAVNIGSGYPSDPYTQKFLKENYKKFTGIFRKSWSTYKDITNVEIKAKAAKLQKKLGEF
ncbi:TPA: ribonuclease HII [Candidatus Woesearchaeota archaeon]|nr:ribonuclease HII [Candidatus Woesearchaeota archaeon]